MPDVANEITMDLLLSRKTAEEIVRYARTFYVPFYTEPELEHLVSHAAHCDSAMVPDDYVLNPDKYERGEHYLYQRARSRDEDDLGQV